MNTLITGAAFGAALAASGVYQPSVIVSQLTLENWHMIQSFLTATAGSALLATILQKLGYVNFKPRSYSGIGLFASWDGNVLGGLLLGAGMALSGSCPGTVLAQTAVGIRSGYYALGGGIAGGILWASLLRPSLNKVSKQADNTSPKTSINEALQISKTAALALLESIFIAVVAGTVAYTAVGPEARIHPVIGGLLIAASQLISLILRRSLLGVSTSYEQVGDWLNWYASSGKSGARPSTSSITFALGMVAGVVGLSVTSPTLFAPTSITISPAPAFAGGLLMVVGSRMAGGCTSGHGISGISLLSLSSIITIGSAFGFGAGIAKLLY